VQYKSFDRWMNLYVLDPQNLPLELIEKLNELYNLNGLEKVYNDLKENKIIPFGAHILSHIGRDAEYWDTVHKSFLERNTKILSETKSIFHFLNNIGITSACLFENFGTVILTDVCLGCFCSGDIDLTVDYSEKHKIHSMMLELGYTLDSRRNVKENIMSSYYKYGVLADEIFWVNFEWKPVARKYITNMNKLEKRLADFRRNAIVHPETGIRILNRNELMYFNLLHIAFGHYYGISPGIRLYVDIDRLARNQEIDWKMIYRWAEEDAVEIRVSTVLKVAKAILGSPIKDIPYFGVTKEKYIKKILDYLSDTKVDGYLARPSIINQITIDSLSEGMPFTKYCLLRASKFGKS
jgi:hypothetical protein